MERVINQIKKRMAERSVTGYALAKATGMSFAQTYRIIGGKNTNIRQLKQVCEALGLELTTRPKAYESK